MVSAEQWFVARPVLSSRGHWHSLETFLVVTPQGAAGLRGAEGRVQPHASGSEVRGPCPSATVPALSLVAVWDAFRKPRARPRPAEAVRLSVPVEPVSRAWRPGVFPVPWATLAPSGGGEPLLPAAAGPLVASHLPMLSAGSTAALALTCTGGPAVAQPLLRRRRFPARGDRGPHGSAAGRPFWEKGGSAHPRGACA